MWCVAELDAENICKMEDVLAVYEKPLDPKAQVVCLDEKPVSPHAEVRPPRFTRRDARFTFGYQRNLSKRSQN
jgi:hypothetical protein